MDLPRLLLVVAVLHCAWGLEVSNKLDLTDEDDETDDAAGRTPAAVVVDVRVVVSNGSTASPQANKEPNIPTLVQQYRMNDAAVILAGGHLIPSYASFASPFSSIIDVNKVHSDVAAANSISAIINTKTAEDEYIPINIGSDERQKTHFENVPVITGKCNQSAVTPDIPVVVGLNLGPEFIQRHSNGNRGRVRPHWPPPPTRRRHPLHRPHKSWKPPQPPLLLLDDKINFEEA